MNTILVTGATGNVGRQVVSQLLAEGATVRALARDPGTAGLPEGAEVVRGDLSDPGSLGPALDGADAVFLVWPFGTAEGAPPVLDAIAAHARRVIYLSSMSVKPDLVEQGDPISQFHADLEGLIEKSGLEWTFLRPSGFAINALWLFDAQIRDGGVVRQPFANLSRPLIHERDIAAVAVRALTGDGHAGATYLLSGPQAMTQAEQVRTIGEVIGSPARFEEIPPAEARERMLAEGWPASFADGVLAGWAAMVTDPEPVTSTVREITGTPARPFREWISDHAADFR
jgi:uncharacterized protein YbjT (DUF2867 family)